RNTCLIAAAATPGLGKNWTFTNCRHERLINAAWEGGVVGEAHRLVGRGPCLGFRARQLSFPSSLSACSPSPPPPSRLAPAGSRERTLGGSETAVCPRPATTTT